MRAAAAGQVGITPHRREGEGEGRGGPPRRPPRGAKRRSHARRAQHSASGPGRFIPSQPVPSAKPAPSSQEERHVL